MFWYLGSPRPNVGAHINTAGKTRDHYFGPSWAPCWLQNLFGAGTIFSCMMASAARSTAAISIRGRPIHESSELGYQLVPESTVGAPWSHLERQSRPTTTWA